VRRHSVGCNVGIKWLQHYQMASDTDCAGP